MTTNAFGATMYGLIFCQSLANHGSRSTQTRIRWWAMAHLGGTKKSSPPDLPPALPGRESHSLFRAGNAATHPVCCACTSTSRSRPSWCPCMTAAEAQAVSACARLTRQQAYSSPWYGLSEESLSCRACLTASRLTHLTSSISSRSGWSSSLAALAMQPIMSSQLPARPAVQLRGLTLSRGRASPAGR